MKRALSILKICSDRPSGSHDRRPCGIATTPNLDPSAKNLVDIYTKVTVWFISVVWHVCRVIDVTSPAQNLKKCHNLPRTTLGSHNRRP